MKKHNKNASWTENMEEYELILKACEDLLNKGKLKKKLFDKCPG